jgi:hypothetical protein
LRHTTFGSLTKEIQPRRFFMADTAQVVGGYGPFEPVDAKTKDIFAKAMAGPVGVGYTPLIVATQVVDGTNYLYMCNAQVVAPGTSANPMEVIVFQPLNGPPKKTSIKNVS